MATSLLSSPALPMSLADISRLATPSSYADLAALGLVALGSAGYLLRGKTWDKPDPYRHVFFERPQEKDAAGRAATKETRNIAQKLEESGKQLVVFWGSQSGTAEGLANRLARECHLRFGLDTMAADLSDYDSDTIALIPETKLAIFILSTFGEGDPSDNTAMFWEWIHKSSDISLSNLRYMAFGLGNRNYKYYNKVVDVVVEALDRFGAKSLMPVGKADDAEGATEEDFMAWKDALFSVFKRDLHFQEREIAHEPTLSVVEDESLEPIDLHHGEPVQKLASAKATAASSPIKALSIKAARELFTSPSRNCLHVELDLSEHPELHYKTGDHLAVWPTNPDVEVARLLRVLGLTARADVPVSIKSLDAAVKVKIPTPTTANALFRYYLEICAPISRDTILSLAQFAPSPATKAYLTHLGSDRDAYAHFLSRTHLNFGRLLEVAGAQDAASTESPVWTALPLSFVLETLAPTQPRYYSISSSSVVAPRTPSITAVVSTSALRNNAGEAVHGLTTNYLLAHKQTLTAAPDAPVPHPHNLTYDLAGPAAALSSGKVFAHIRRSRFKLPVLSSQAIVLVAAGTGLAPFRAFLSERARLKTMGKPIGPTLLFFGCRHPDEDYLYRDELAALQAVLADELHIVTAFSRLGEAAPKVYVQDRVAQQAERVAQLLGEHNANLYVCGSAAMARDVGVAVGKAMQTRMGWGEAELKGWSEGRKRGGK